MKPSIKGIHFSNRGEVRMLIIVALQAILIGAFISLFTIGSHVLFFQTWDNGYIAQAFIISGIFGIFLLSLYSFFSSITGKSRLFTFPLLFLVFIICSLLYIFHDKIADINLFGVPLMFPFTVCIPLTFFVTILFRQSVSNIFTPFQLRKFNPVVRLAFISGIIGTSYALVGALYITWDVLLIIAASAGFIGMASILQLFVKSFRRKSGGIAVQYKRIGPLRSKFWELFYTRYTFLLVTFVVLSATIGFIIHYHFISETRLNYPSTIGLAKFFGFFIGTMFLFIFGIERFLLRKILYAYDSPYSLVLIPAVLVLASIASLTVDLLVGQSNAIARFSFGFLMIAMLKIGYETTFEAIEIPSLRVLFRTLDLRFITSIKTRLEGTFRMFSLLLAGILLFIIAYFNLTRSLFINSLIIFLTLCLFPIGIMLVKAYQNALREYIKRLKASKRAIGQELLNIDEKSHYLINSPDPLKSIHTLSIIERLEPLTHEKHLTSLLETESVQLRDYLLKRIDESALLSSLPALKEVQEFDSHKNQNGHLSKLINRFEIKLSAGNSRKAIESIVNSHTLTDRILAAEIIGNSGVTEYSDFLLQLSRDFEPEVKLASIKAMARLSDPNHSYVLIGYLTTPYYYHYAFEALVKIGDPALPFMEENFLIPDVDNALLLRIVRIYGKIGSQAAIESLLSKIENQNRVISRQALFALREAKFQASPRNINRILNDIVRLINLMSWNFSAYASIRDYPSYRLLKDAFRSEINDNYETLYQLLTLAYNSTSIGNIKILLSEGSDIDISFAIELLDQIVNEEIKQVFFPVVENISIKERHKQLQYFFQSSKEKPENLIPEIITRDFNQISLYVKACAIISLLNQDQKLAEQEVIACVFHPNQLIRETAAFVLHNVDHEKLESVLERLDKDRSNELKHTMNHLNDELPYLLIDRIRFIKNCHLLMNISEDVLLEISRALVIHQMKKNEEFLVKREDVHFAFMIIIDGTARINNSSGKVFTFEKNDIIYSDILVENSTYSFKALTDLRFYSLEQDVLNSLMFDHIEFRDAILAIIEAT